MYFDRFDIVAAHYVFYSDFHGGQWSREYARPSKISTYFHTSGMDYDKLTENGKEIYNNLLQVYL